jgi:hypothetical protein
MHATLRLLPNLGMMAAWLVVAIAAWIMSQPAPLVPVVLGAGFGVVIGFLQARSIRSSARAFQGAATAVDVRRALTSTAHGRRAIQVQWAGALLLLVAAVLIRNPLGGFVAGYAAFMFARDLVSLNEVIALRRSAVER